MAETPREFAQLRARELKKLLARLRAGDALTPGDVNVATTRATEARRRAVHTHLRAAERHLASAEVHERAAALYGDMAKAGDNVEARLRALDHTAAAERKRIAADTEVRRAIEAAQHGGA
jgi:hypothetical protein